MKSLSQLLGCLGVSAGDLDGCAGLKDEFSKVKKSYFKKILSAHPDKGGDPAEFREIQTSFEIVREMFTSGRIKTSFAAAMKSKSRVAREEEQDEDYEEGYEEGYEDYDVDDTTWDSTEVPPTQPWDYYSQAAQEEMPSYRVELAVSGRSVCKYRHCETPDEPIPKGGIRIGSLDAQSGGYGRFVHLRCWRVPSKIWLGLPDPDVCQDMKLFEAALLSMNEILLCGFNVLPPAARREVINRVMDRSCWARLTKAKAKPVPEPEQQPQPQQQQYGAHPAGASSSSAAGGETGGAAAARAGSSELVQHPASTAMTTTGGRQFQIQAINPHPLAGKTFVLTGLFPEVGGGVGLNLGKERTKALIRSLGGRVTTAISGVTDILLVGKEPGFSKVSKARASSKITLMTLHDLKLRLEGGGEGATAGSIEEYKPDVKITSFSSGYGGNSKRLRELASAEDRARAAGYGPASLTQEPDHTPPAAPTTKANKKNPAARRPAAATATHTKGKAAPKKKASPRVKKRRAAGEDGGGETNKPPGKKRRARIIVIDDDSE